jgi:hypothetical protein
MPGVSKCLTRAEAPFGIGSYPPTARLCGRNSKGGVLSDALARGETITGVSLVKGHHVRLR